MSDRPDAIVDIWVKWDRFGYVAINLINATHHNGPRKAAAEVCQKVFRRPFKLIYLSKHHYRAEVA